MPRRYTQAESVTDELLANKPEGLLSKYEVIGIARKMLKDEAGAREAFQTAKRYAEEYLSEAPDDAARHALLAQVLAGLGEKSYRRGRSLAWASRMRQLRKRNGPPKCFRKVSMLSTARR